MAILLRARRALLLLLAAGLALLLGLGFRILVVPLIQQSLPPSEGLTSLLRIATLVCVLLTYAGYVRWVEKRPVTELRFMPWVILLAAVAGVLMISITTGILFALDYYTVSTVRGLDGTLAIAGTIWAVAMFEELIYRGILFRILEEVIGTWPALWLQSLIFGAMHLSNIEADPLTMGLTLVGTVLVGAVWTCIFVATRNLWVAGAHHATWNLGIVMTGVPLSGLVDWRNQVPLESTYQGPVWLTGGAYGPEASVICISVCLLAILALVTWAKRHDRVIGFRSRLVRPSRPVLAEGQA